jgi:uncharacterized damage-inducible protein DinB
VLREGLAAAWRTSNRVTIDLVENLPRDFWEFRVPASTRTVRAIAAHLHNARCSWIKTLGSEHGVMVPERVDFRRATPKQVASALKKSGRAMEELFALERDGMLPSSRRYVWRNLSLDIAHVVTYFIAHDAHHRGQVVMLARETGHRLPRKVVDGLWQWK